MRVSCEKDIDVQVVCEAANILIKRMNVVSQESRTRCS